MLAQKYPISVACAALGIARSSYYYRPAEAADEAELKKAIKETAAKWPKYGYRRITEQLRRGKWPVNHKRVRRYLLVRGLPHQLMEEVVGVSFVGAKVVLDPIDGDKPDLPGLTEPRFGTTCHEKTLQLKR